MTVKMIATDRYYDRRQGKEFKKGDPFTVPDEASAALLERRKKAKRDTAVAAPAKAAPAPAMKSKVMRAETAAVPAAEPAPPREATGGIIHTTDNNAPSGEINANRPNRYRRSDMRSED